MYAHNHSTRKLVILMCFILAHCSVWVTCIILLGTQLRLLLWIKAIHQTCWHKQVFFIFQYLAEIVTCPWRRLKRIINRCNDCLTNWQITRSMYSPRWDMGCVFSLQIGRYNSPLNKLVISSVNWSCKYTEEWWLIQMWESHKWGLSSVREKNTKKEIKYDILVWAFTWSGILWLNHLYKRQLFLYIKGYKSIFGGKGVHSTRSSIGK